MLLIKKQPSERYLQFVDFTPLLGAGELASATPISWTSFRTPSLWAGDSWKVQGDSSTVVESALASSTGSLLVIRRGTAGQIYKVDVLVSTSGGNSWEDELVIQVEEN